MENEAANPERPLVPSMGVRGEGRVRLVEEPRRGRGAVMPNAPLEGRREDDEEGRRAAVSWVEGRLDVAGEKATAGVGGPSCPWSSMCSRFASSVLKMKPLGIALPTTLRYVSPTHFATNVPPGSTRGRRCRIRRCAGKLRKHVRFGDRTVPVYKDLQYKVVKIRRRNSVT